MTVPIFKNQIKSIRKQLNRLDSKIKVLQGKQTHYESMRSRFPNPIFPDECCGGWYHDKFECTKPDKCLLHPRPAPEQKCSCLKVRKWCPKHGFDATAGLEDHVRDMILEAVTIGSAGIKTSKVPDPDPPLNVQVAKHLGENVFYAGKVEGWHYMTPDMDISEPVLRRDTDIALAMGALEEYKLKSSIRVCIYLYGKNDYKSVFFSVILDDRRDRDPIKVESDFLPEAICQAIVKHAEG